jgi:hypothetical protein
MTAVSRLNRVYVALLALLVVLVFEQWLGARIDSPRVTAGLHGAFHGLWYALMTWLVLLVLQQRFAPFHVWLWIAGIWFGMFVIATLVELSKAFVDQPLGVRDVLLNMLGVTAVLALWGADRGVLPVLGSVLLAAVLLATSTLPIWQARALQNYRDSLLPQLIVFDDDRAQRLLQSNSALRVIDAPADWPDYTGRRVLEVRFADTEFPGIALPEPIPDWQTYARLVIDVYVPDQRRRDLLLYVRVRPRGAADAYVIDRRFELIQGAHRLELALNDDRGAKLPRVAELRLHTNEDHRDRRLIIGDVRLE